MPAPPAVSLTRLVQTLVCATALAGVAHATPARFPAASPDGGMHVDGLPWDTFDAGTSAIMTGVHAVTVARVAGEPVTLARAIDPADAAAAFVVSLDLQVLAAGSGETQAFTLGDGAHALATLGVAPATGGWQLLAGDARSATFAGTQAVTWALNRASVTHGYDAPDGSTATLAAGRMDVWIGRTRVFQGLPLADVTVTVRNLTWTATGDASARTTFHALDVRATQAAAGDAAVAAAAAAPADPAIALYRATPNPFAGAMRLAYAVSSSTTSVDIGVYDVAGRHVRTLVHATQAAGRHETGWDGRSDSGARLTSGVYFVRAAVGSETRVLRVVSILK